VWGERTPLMGGGGAVPTADKHRSRAVLATVQSGVRLMTGITGCYGRHFQANLIGQHGIFYIFRQRIGNSNLFHTAECFFEWLRNSLLLRSSKGKLPYAVVLLTLYCSILSHCVVPAFGTLYLSTCNFDWCSLFSSMRYMVRRGAVTHSVKRLATSWTTVAPRLGSL
jgi:hypothetical protein